MDHDDSDNTIVVGSRPQAQQVEHQRPASAKRPSQSAIPHFALASNEDASAHHACIECDARFTRRDHLKRHINSLHSGCGAKSHTCQLCGKSFARRDVLLRHHLSCSAAKNGNTSSETNAKRVKLSCQRCNEFQLRCSGLAPCENCAQVGHVCANIDRSKKGRAKKASALPSPADSAESQRLHSPNAYDDFLNEFNESQQDNNVTFETLGASATADSALSATDRTLQPERSKRPANKRGRYVSKACISCQKRKVKCSGDETCLQCSAAEVQCVYNSGRRRQRSKPDQVSSIRAEVGKVTASASNGSSEQAPLLESLMQIMSRISDLERNQTWLKNSLTVDEDDGESVSDSESGHSDGSDVPNMVWNDVVHGATSLLDVIDTLNRTVACDEHAPLESRDEYQDSIASKPTTWQSFPRGGEKDIRTLSRETRMNNVHNLRNSVDIFFTHMSPLYPYLNEAIFRADFEAFLANEVDDNQTADGYQFVALVNLMHATILVLDGNCPDSSSVPGWEGFCRAETILNHIVWMGNGNLLTVSILLTKTLYLLYIEKADSAYDTMGRVVRLCFQLGLHNQSSWKGCSPFDIVMRQRIFRTVLYLERSLSFNCGAPFLVRESDFKVDMPKYYDDKCMFPGQPLPEECPTLSYGPYLESAGRFSRLCSEIWDAIFGVNAKERKSQEFTVSMDARILYVGAQLPAHLQWNTDTVQTSISSDYPHWISRQRFILYLRMNQLRMLLRQESMLSLEYSNATATESLSIATNSVNAVQLYYHSETWKPTDRLASVLYLMGSLLSMVCIIVKNDNPAPMRATAIESYTKGLNMLYDMAPNFSAARHSLQRIHRIIVTAKQAIRRFHQPETSESQEMLPDPDGMNFSMNEPYNFDPWMNTEPDHFSQPYNGPMLTCFPNVPVQDFGGSLNDINSFWTDDDLFQFSGVTDANKLQMELGCGVDGLT